MKYYVSYYEEYPIYEPAEGGYYYSGTGLVTSREFSERRKAMRYLRKLRKFSFTLKNKFLHPCFPSKEERYCSDDGTFFGCHGQYVGEGWFVILEKKRGEHESGWQPYC